MGESILKLQQIRKSFDHTEVLKGVDLEVAQGEFITLLGASGCGKTTTLRIIAGLELPDSGSVILEGRDITDWEPNKRDVNTVFQNYALFPHMNVADNVGYGLKIRKVPKAEITERVKQALRLVQLEEYGKRMPDQLSGGQRQRIAIARAVINEPKVLLLDEPLGALDLKLRRQMQLELKRLQKQLGITFIYITHDQEEALAISDRIAVMKEGNIMQVGTPEAIYKKPENTFVAGFIGVSNFVECEVDGKNPEAAVLNIKDECSITCKLKKPFSGKGIISARPEQLFFDESNGLPGKIVMSTFLGDFIEYEIELNNGQTLQLNEYTKDVQMVRPDGEQVKVNFDINAVGVYDAATQEVISW